MSAFSSPFVVFIPTLRCYDLLEECLRSIRRASVQPVAVIIMDNGKQWSCAQTEESCKRAQDDFDLPLMLCFPEEPMCVAACWNWACQFVFDFKSDKRPSLMDQQPSLIICNDDIFVEPGAFASMLASKDTFVTTKGGYGMFLIRQQCWQTIGAFDENFKPAYFEDTDHWRRLQTENFPNEIIPIRGYENQESGSSTLKRFSPEERAAFDNQYKESASYYEVKWGGPPGNEKFTIPFGTC